MNTPPASSDSESSTSSIPSSSFTEISCDVDPIIVFKANPNWINAYPVNTLARRDVVLDSLATWNINGGQRRDESARHFLYHFDTSQLINRCKADLKQRPLLRCAFGIPEESLAELAGMGQINLPTKPAIGETYVIHKLQVRQDDVENFLVRFYRLERSVYGNGASTSNFGGEGIAQPPSSSHQGPKQVSNLINAYRRFGYLEADLDPLRLCERRAVPELDPSTYGFDAESLANALNDGSTATGEEFIKYLRQLYCGKIAVEFMHLSNINERQWFAETYERCLAENFDTSQKIDALKIMLQGKAWENFLATKFPTLKRYSGEGSESALALHQYLLEESANFGIKEFIFDGAHRGRLALQTSVFQFSPAHIFRKIRGKAEFPSDIQGSGDVLTHQPVHFDYRPKAEKNADKLIHVSTVPNPSHLEVSLAIALGKCRARAQTLRLGDYAKNPTAATMVGDGILSVHHHGDGAFTGQGVVWESLLLSAIPHFRIGGSIHVVVNNQIAFTAEKFVGRSSRHCTDVAKAIDAPVIHVNGEDVEKVLMAAKLALLYRQNFRKEVFINLVCYRKHGHNELDDPSFTQPLMYRRIGEHLQEEESVVDQFAAELEESGEFSAEDTNKCYGDYLRKLEEDLAAVDAGKVPPRSDHLQGQWKGFVQAPAAVTKWDTGVSLDLLRFIGAKSVEIPNGFELHPHLRKTHVDARLRRLTDGGPSIDWSTAEALAFGSLLLQNFDVRISGQDVGRATFSHRHAMLVDQSNDSVHIPLNCITKEQRSFLEIANTPLSEGAILGFEYGFAMENPRRLVIWEAQFGDFYNGAQMQIDTLLATGESKWLRQNGLVLLLPHGFDGAGPDHSSAHVERFLQLTDSRETAADGENVNMVVAHPTTSSQYFHLLRRQMIVPYRKPLIIIGPKVLLRHSAAASPLEAFGPGTFFKPILFDEARDHTKVRKIIFTSGKHAVTLSAELEKRKLTDSVAIIRLECLCPFPLQDLTDALANFKNAKEFVWSQEEPRNAGCWSFVRPRFRNLLGIELSYTGRPEIAWTATAIGEHHAKESQDILDSLFS